jgi:hypothetical protein
MRRLVVICLLSCLAASCSSQLTRSKAETLIRSSDWFKERLHMNLPIGTFCDGVTQAYSDPDSYIAFNLLPKGDMLSKMPAIFVHVSAKDVNHQMQFGPVPTECQKFIPPGAGPFTLMLTVSRYHYYSYTVTLTPAGERLGLPKSGGPVEMATRTFDSITGLIVNQNGTTKAEFKWRWSPNELANQLMNFSRDLNVDAGGAALFTLYDDGWRITGINEGPLR